MCPALTPAQVPYHQGMVYEAGGDARRAMASYKEAIALHFDHVRAHLAPGDLLTKQGYYNEARSSYKHVIRIAGDIPRVHYSLGLLSLALDDKAGAMRAYNFVRTREPDLAKKLLAKINR